MGDKRKLQGGVYFRFKVKLSISEYFCVNHDDCSDANHVILYELHDFLSAIPCFGD